jgi:hypothetical protein
MMVFTNGETHTDFPSKPDYSGWQQAEIDR